MFIITEKFVDEFFCKVLIECLFDRFGSCAFRAFDEVKHVVPIPEDSDFEDS